MIVYKHILMRNLRLSQQNLQSLVSYQALSSLADCFKRFKGTSCFKIVIDSLLGYTMLHPRKSKPDLQVCVTVS